MISLFEAIKTIAEENPDGFTVRIPELTWVTEGYIVAYLDTQDCFGDEGLKKVILHAEKHGRIVGGWLNSENEMFYFDSSRNFENLDDAVRFGRENKQIAIFDLNTFREIRL